jgi:hypothetical protein
VGHDEGRPMLKTPDLAGLLERRLPVYRRTADLIVHTEGREPETIVLDILSSIPAPSPGPTNADRGER